ncbi:MAG: hypothetical protein ABL897_07690 [Hyphomicrobium sp.]
MKLFVPSISALAVLFSVATAPAADAAPKTYGKYAASQSGKYKARAPLRGVIYGRQRRVGGYSYKYSDVIEPGSRYNPAVTGMHESGVIDGDFFYPRPSGPFGGYTPYMR